MNENPSGRELSLTDFKKKLWRGYRHPAHVARLDEHLSQVGDFLYSEGRTGIGRLMVFMPPRSGKSWTAARYFPAWVMGWRPQTQVLLTSYAQRLANDHARYIRNLMHSARYQAFYPVKISPDKHAADHFTLMGGGQVLAAGVGGGITGHGADLIIIDDPIKSRAEAESALLRERRREWYRSDLRTRLEPPGAVVLVQTRWHQDDLAGWLLAENIENWQVLKVPALQPDGTSFWQERFPVEALLTLEKQLGDYDFAALYQQEPLPARGRLFDVARLPLVEASPVCLRSVRFYDLALTAKKRADYTAGLHLGLLPAEQFIVLDVWRAQLELPDVIERIVQTAQGDGAAVAIRLEGEKAGLAALQSLLRDERLRGFALDVRAPQGDKYTRASAPAARVNAGRVLVRRGAWNTAFIEELQLFPDGRHDDMVDALSGAYAMLVEGLGVDANSLKLGENPFF